MEKDKYKPDTLAIREHKQAVAFEKFEEIEKKCSTNAVAFLKENHLNKKIRDRKTEPNFKILLAICWNKICGLAGIKKEVDSFVVEDITKMIFYSYSDLTIEEIYKAFEMERYAIYDTKTEHYQEFNADYISTVLKKYKAWKTNTRTQLNIEEQNKEKELSEEEKEEIVKNGVNRVYNEFRETGKIEGNCEYIFDFLCEKKIIKNSNNPKLIEYYQSKLDEAKEQLKSEMIDVVYPNKQTKIDYANVIGGNSPKILLRAKRNILIEFFAKQIECKNENVF